MSSTKQKLIAQIDNFINDIYRLYPSNNEIIVFKESYFLIKQVNSNLILEYFITYIYPHKDQILEKDEAFFLEGGGQEVLSETSELRFRDNLKNLWENNMSAENKEIMWKYFKVFVLLCEKYILESISSST